MAILLYGLVFLFCLKQWMPECEEREDYIVAVIGSLFWPILCAIYVALNEEQMEKLSSYLGE